MSDSYKLRALSGLIIDMAVKDCALSDVSLIYFWRGRPFALEWCQPVLPVLSGVRAYINEPGGHCFGVVR